MTLSIENMGAKNSPGPMKTISLRCSSRFWNRPMASSCIRNRSWASHKSWRNSRSVRRIFYVVRWVRKNRKKWPSSEPCFWPVAKKTISIRDWPVTFSTLLKSLQAMASTSRTRPPTPCCPIRLPGSSVIMRRHSWHRSCPLIWTIPTRSSDSLTNARSWVLKCYHLISMPLPCVSRLSMNLPCCMV